MRFLLLLLFLNPLFSDFQQLMGKRDELQFIETPEDRSRLEFFEKIFEKQNESIVQASEEKIPRVFHFVWIGPDPLPKECKERLAAWISLHPEWKFKFWADVQQSAPFAQMEFCQIFPFKRLRDAFNKATNFGEKSKILAYEILLQEGGVYIDPHLMPIKPLDEMASALDFFCGLERLGPAILSTSIVASPHLIGAKANHPILEEGTRWLRDHWDEVEKDYPGESKAILYSRIKHRTFWALSEGIEQGISQEGNVDMIYPVSFFNGTEATPHAYTVHVENDAWVKAPPHFEVKIQRKFQKMIDKDEKAILLTLVLALASFIGTIILFMMIRSQSQRPE